MRTTGSGSRPGLGFGDPRIYRGRVIGQQGGGELLSEELLKSLTEEMSSKIRKYRLSFLLVRKYGFIELKLSMKIFSIKQKLMYQ